MSVKIQNVIKNEKILLSITKLSAVRITIYRKQLAIQLTEKNPIHEDYMCYWNDINMPNMRYIFQQKIVIRVFRNIFMLEDAKTKSWWLDDIIIMPNTQTDFLKAGIQHAIIITQQTNKYSLMCYFGADM